LPSKRRRRGQNASSRIFPVPWTDCVRGRRLAAWRFCPVRNPCPCRRKECDAVTFLSETSRYLRGAANALAILLILLLSLVVSVFGLVNTVVLYVFILLAVPSLSLEAKCADWAKTAPWPLNVLSRVLSRALLWFMGILFGLVMLLNIIF